MVEPDFLSPESAEELLLSRTADVSTLAEALAREYASAMQRLALALLENAAGARQAMIEALGMALSSAPAYRSSTGVTPWLYRFTIQACRRLEHQYPRMALPITYQDEAELLVWKWLDGLERRERTLAILHYVFGMTDEAAATALGVSATAAVAQVKIFTNQLSGLLEGLGPSAEREAGPGLRIFAGNVLAKRWAEHPISPSELAQIAHQAQEAALVQRQLAYRRQMIRLSALAMGGLILMVSVLTIGAFWLVWSRISATATAPAVVEGAATPVTPAAALPPLTRRASSAQIIRRMQESSNLWNTLWIEVQITRFGPRSYIGPPKTYRVQAWISQPDESIELFGSLPSTTSQIHMVAQGSAITVNPFLQENRIEQWNGDLPTLIDTPELRDLVFPMASSWVSQAGWFDTLKDEPVLGRNCIVADWRNESNIRLARLWIDAASGVVLRLQEFDPENGKILLNEMIATQFFLDQNRPPIDLSKEVAQAEAPLPTGQPQTPRLIQPTPTTAVLIERRSPLALVAPPQGFNPSHSTLRFQFPFVAEVAYIRSKTAQVEADLFADEAWLGKIHFGLPWVLRCARSPNGRLLAFNTYSDGDAQPDGSLRWFDLASPEMVYQPIPHLEATAFAFSPDSARLAVFGLGDSSLPTGLYLITLPDSQYRLLLPVDQADSLVWSPDGTVLAFRGRRVADNAISIYLLSLDTGIITFNMGMETFQSQASRSPIATWGVKFPVKMGDMDSCSAPPQP